MASFKFTAKDKLACVERELVHRRRVYKRLVESGKLEPHVARREYDLMQAIREDYKELADRLYGTQGGLFESTSKHNDQG